MIKHKLIFIYSVLFILLSSMLIYLLIPSVPNNASFIKPPQTLPYNEYFDQNYDSNIVVLLISRILYMLT